MLPYPLQGLFSRRAGPKALPAPANTKEPFNQAAQSARALFADALHGYKCRTIAFHIANDDEQKRQIKWQQALYTGPESKWQVTDIIEDENGLSHNPVVEGLDFFSAIEYLANFENGNMTAELEFYEPCESLVEELGHEHYKAFAEREGIIFDQDDKPHPTLNGEIVTQGHFTAEAIARARAFKRNAAHLQPLSYGQELLSSMTTGQDMPADDMERIIKKYEIKAEIDTLIKNFTLMADLTKACFTGPIKRKTTKSLINPADMNNIRGFDDDATLVSGSRLYDIQILLPYGARPSDLIKETIKTNTGIIKNLTLSEESRSSLLDQTYYHGTLFFLMAANLEMAIAKQGNSVRLTNLNNARDYTIKAQKYHDMITGSTEEDFNKIRGYVFLEMPKNKQAMPPDIHKPVEYLEKLRSAIKDEINRDVKLTSYRGPGS